MTAAAPTTGAYFAPTAGLNPADVFLTVTDSQVHAVVVLGATAEVGLGRIESDGTLTVIFEPSRPSASKPPTTRLPWAMA